MGLQVQSCNRRWWGKCVESVIRLKTCETVRFHTALGNTGTVVEDRGRNWSVTLVNKGWDGRERGMVAA